MTIIVYNTLREAFDAIDYRAGLGFIASKPMMTGEGAGEVRYV
jgi:hypothetical protein